MDPPPPDDFDPYLGEEEVQHPTERVQKGEQGNDAQSDTSDEVTKMFPFHNFIPVWLRKALFTGTCCGGVVVLYLVGMWDHGYLPGVKSPFASAADAADMAEMITLYLGRDIRDLRDQQCVHHAFPETVKLLQNQIDQLQRRYIARTGQEYPYISCIKL
jgi:hypothetical protein